MFPFRVFTRIERWQESFSRTANESITDRRIRNMEKIRELSLDEMGRIRMYKDGKVLLISR